MRNPDNTRLLEEERALVDSELAVARSEQAVFARLTALESDDSAPRAKTALARVAAIEAAGGGNPDLVRARAVLEAIGVTPPLAIQPRQAAVDVRKAAVQARDIASRSLASVLTASEPAKKNQRTDLAKIEAYVANLEAAIQRRRQGGTPAPAAPGPQPRPKVGG
jgi:hypothetical protein